MIEYLLEPLHDPISRTFAILIGILLFVGLYRAKARHGLSAFDRYSPTALTSIGVIGTFTGVYVGLMEFDVTDIEASVPILLSGLKIAFSTSILGMCASVLLKFFQSAVRPKSEKEDVSAIDIHRVMEEIREETRLARQSDEQLMEKIRNAIAGDGDSSLVTQIQKLRNATQDGYDDLKKTNEQGFSALQAELHDFSEKVTDNSSKAFIEALQEVIGDFNTKINEQFGDNFKQLNEAVGSLLVWQETYKNQLKIMIDQFNEIVSGVANVNSALNDIKLATDEIPASMDKLRTVLQTTSDQSEILQKQLGSGPKDYLLHKPL